MLGFVSHELRNPVVSMLSNASLLADGLLGALQPQQQEEIQRILAKGDYLLNLIREYLDLTQIDDDRLRLNIESGVKLRERIVEPAVEIVWPQIKEKHMRLVYDPDVPVGPICCDVELLKIVLINLLSNAAKYGFKGGEIRLGCYPSDGGLSVAVFNEGPGFPDEQRPRLFRKFSRLQTPELLCETGTGIGLYTVWRIVQLHGGKVSADSREGQWARFTLEIPQPPPTSADEEAAL